MAKAKAAKTSAAEKAPPSGGAAPAFKRGFFSLTFTFSLFIGLLLFGLLVVVTLVVNSQLRTDLTREVAERGNSVARSIAASCWLKKANSS